MLDQPAIIELAPLFAALALVFIVATIAAIAITRSDRQGLS